MRTRLCALSLVAFLALCAHPADPHADDVLIGAAASLREPVEWLIADLEARHPGTGFAPVFGASSAIAAQIRLGAPLDVFLSANRELVDDLVARGRIEAGSVFTFARNSLVVIAAPGGVAPFSDPRALARPDVERIALPSGAVPLGRYAEAWLEARGLGAALAGKRVTTEHARATLAAVEAGNADLGIVYATDARTSTRVRVVYAVPAGDAGEIAYVAGRSATRVEATPVDLAWVALREPGFAAALDRAGFLPASPTPSTRAPGGPADR